MGLLIFGIWYSKDTNMNLAGFCDANWTGNANDRKSTNGDCFYLGNKLISWHNKKQNSISLATAKAEYINCCWQLLYTTVLDEADARGLWYCIRFFDSLL